MISALINQVLNKQKAKKSFYLPHNSFPNVIDYLSNQATKADIRIAEYLVQRFLRLRTVIHKQGTIAQVTGYSRETVNRSMQRLNNVLFTKRLRFKHNKQRSSLYIAPEWINDANCIRQLSHYLKSLRMLPMLLLFSVFPPVRGFEPRSDKMSQRVIKKEYLYNILLNKSSKNPVYRRDKTMYTPDKPDYVKRPQEEEPKSVDRRKLYPQWQSPKPIERDKKADTAHALAWLQNETDPHIKLGKDFLAFLGPEITKNLFINHITPTKLHTEESDE